MEKQELIVQILDSDQRYSDAMLRQKAKGKKNFYESVNKEIIKQIKTAIII